MSSRESYEVSEKAAIDSFSRFETCIHGNYPHETDCGCKYPAAPKALVEKWKHKREPIDSDTD